MLATLLLAVAAATTPLPECSTLTTAPWKLAETQLDMIAEDPDGAHLERVRARSSHKKAANGRIDKWFYGDENWLAIDVLKPTVCGPVRTVEMFGHIFSFDEADVHFTVAPEEPTLTLITGLSSAASVKMCKVPGASGRKEPCVFGEVTPNHVYEDQLCTTQCTFNGTNFAGQPWDGIRDVCVRGPIALELMHGFRPEVHPAELTWARFGTPPRWLAMVTRDASQRFDHSSYFAPWPTSPNTFGPWSVTATARFDLWFVADTGKDPSFTLKPRVGLLPDTPVQVAIGGTTTGLPAGLTADAQYVCRDGATRLRGRLSLGIAAKQRGEKNQGGRDGKSHSVAVEIVRGEMAASPSPVAPPPVEFVALARKARRPPGDGIPHRVELDAIFVTDPERSEEEHYYVEELNARRHPDEARHFDEPGKRPFQIDVSFSTEPSRPIRPIERLKLDGACHEALGKHDAVLVAVSVQGQTDVTLTGPNIEKAAAPEASYRPDTPPDTGGRPERQPGMATVDVCVPDDMKQVTLRSAVSSRIPQYPLKSETSLDVMAKCPSAQEILEREGNDLHIPPETIATLVQSGQRVLTLIGEQPAASDEGPRPLLARASYALALSMAADCPHELKARKPGGKAVLTGLMQKYAGS